LLGRLPPARGDSSQDCNKNQNCPALAKLHHGIPCAVVLRFCVPFEYTITEGNGRSNRIGCIGCPFNFSVDGLSAILWLLHFPH
jgi:hypothetical protein